LLIFGGDGGGGVSRSDSVDRFRFMVAILAGEFTELSTRRNKKKYCYLKIKAGTVFAIDLTRYTIHSIIK
jgi:hypothetical protein